MKTSVLIFTAATFAGGCAMGDSAGRHVTERDSAGITIVENGAPPAEWRLSVQPELRIGVVDGEPAYQFHLVRHAARMQDGRVVVVDGGSMQIRFFAADGLHTSTLGRRGGGPGEFQFITAVTTIGADSLLIYDSRNERLTFVDPAEHIAGQRSFRNAIAPGRSIRLIGTSPPNRVIALIQGRDVQLPARVGFTIDRDTARLDVLDLATETVATLSRLGGSEVINWRADNRVSSFPMIFGYRPAAAMTATGIVMSSAAGAELTVLTPDGAVRRLVRRTDVSPAPVTGELRERYIAYTIANAEKAGRSVSEAESAARDQMALIPAAHTVPLYDRILTSAAGEIWTRDYRTPWSLTEAQLWHVYDGNGRIVARVAMPAALNVMHISSDHVTGVQKDELDVEYVTSYRIDRTGR